MTIEKVGDCTLSGGLATVTGDAVMEWTVYENGSIVITENTFDSEWHGKVNENMGVALKKIVTFIKGETMADGFCYADTVVDTCSYVSWIISDSAGYHISMSTTENWCPDNNCQFKVSYAVQQGH